MARQEAVGQLLPLRVQKIPFLPIRHRFEWSPRKKRQNRDWSCTVAFLSPHQKLQLIPQLAVSCVGGSHRVITISELGWRCCWPFPASCRRVSGGETYSLDLTGIFPFLPTFAVVYLLSLIDGELGFQTAALSGDASILLLLPRSLTILKSFPFRGSWCELLGCKISVFFSSPIEPSCDSICELHVLS